MVAAPFTTKLDARYMPVKMTATGQLVASNTTLASAAYTSATIAATNAAVGDVVLLAPPQDLAGLHMTPWVSAAGVVTIGIYNATTATQTISNSAAFKAVIIDASVGS